jgi:hypothetical protein
MLLQPDVCCDGLTRKLLLPDPTANLPEVRIINVKAVAASTNSAQTSAATAGGSLLRGYLLLRDKAVAARISANTAGHQHQ